MRGGEDGRTPLRCHLAGAPKQALSSGVLWPNETMDLEQTIDALVYRKKALDLDSPDRKFINRILTGPRYSCDEAGGIIEDLDFDWGATCRPLAASPATELRQVLPFRHAAR
jgi:hypothetical protein